MNGRSARRWRERGDFDLFLLAGRYTLLEQEALDSFLPLCTERGIGIVLGGPYNSGILAARPIRRRAVQLCRRAEGRHRSGAPDQCDLRSARREDDRGGAATSRCITPPSSPSSPAARAWRRSIPTVECCGTDIPAALWADLKAEGPDAAGCTGLSQAVSDATLTVGETVSLLRLKIYHFNSL